MMGDWRLLLCLSAMVGAVSSSIASGTWQVVACAPPSQHFQQRPQERAATAATGACCPPSSGSPRSVTVATGITLRHQPRCRRSRRQLISCGAVVGANSDPIEESPASSEPQSQDSAAVLPPGFNPFQYQRSSSSSSPSAAGIPFSGGLGSPAASTSTTTIPPPAAASDPAPSRTFSLRQAQMQELTRALLDLAPSKFDPTPPSPEAALLLLQEYCDLLLEPLEDPESAVVEPGSVYENMAALLTRSERYEAYRHALNDRISKARTPAAKWVLTVLRDFVLSHE